MEEKRLSINFAERVYEGDSDFYGGDEESWVHAYLMLVDETQGKPVIVQELHFNEINDQIMCPNVRNRNKILEADSDLTVVPYIVGQENDILSMWNHGLKHALEIKNLKLKFGEDYRVLPYANNCRTGTKAIIETMGMTFCPEFSKSAAGIKSEALPVGEKFSFSQGGEQLSLQEIHAENKRLAGLLPEMEHIF